LQRKEDFSEIAKTIAPWAALLPHPAAQALALGANATDPEQNKFNLFQQKSTVLN